MPWSIDARIPVVFGSLDVVRDGDALLIERGAVPDAVAGERFDPIAPQVAHPANCACCVERGPAAVALDVMFQQRVRGQVGFFRRVVVLTATAEGDLAVWAAVRDDPVASARYRLETGSSGTS